jgi:hypothetical protein
VTDLLSPSRAWEKLKGVFGPPLGRLRDFAVAAGKKLLEFVFEGALALGGSAAQQVLAIFRRIGAVFGLIAADPVRFLGNLLTAVKGGFTRFAANILAHLRTALFEWLLGALGGALRLPSRWDFAGILSVALQVLGLTYTALRAVLVKIIGEPAVAYVEKIFEFLVLVVTKGLSAAWEKIKEFATGLADAVIGGIRDWVVKSVVGAAITKLVTLFNPIGAIIQAIIAIYNTVMFFIERAKQIARLVNSVIDSVEAIAKGSTAAAAQFVERSMAQTLPVIIAFLARLVGLGNVTEHVRNVIKRVQTAISGAMERVARWIADRVKGLLAGRKGKKDDPAATPKAKSEQIRKRAFAELQTEAAKKLTGAQMTQAVRSVATRLRPEGLQRLEAGAPDPAGVITISAAASDFLPLAQIAPEDVVPRGRQVTLFAELRLTEETAVPRGIIPATGLRGEPLPPGAIDVRVAGRGGGVVLDQPTPTVIRTVTWNTANLDAPGNVSHAEHHFVSWLSGQTTLLPRIRSILLNLKDYSPCATCTDDLYTTIQTIVAARGRRFSRDAGDAVLSWTKPYLGRSGGINATTSQGLRKLEGAGWKLHAPPLPERAGVFPNTLVIITAPTYRPPR